MVGLSMVCPGGANHEIDEDSIHKTPLHKVEFDPRQRPVEGAKVSHCW
jgi:hypothetical protein